MLIKSSDIERAVHDNRKVYGLLSSEQIIYGNSESRNLLRLNLAKVSGL